jgi:lipopolysaccharide export system protein LptC
MSERFTTWFPILLLAVLAALTFWLDRVVRPSAAGPDPTARHDPDYIVDRLTAMRMAANGSVKHTLFADRMIHYPDDDTTHLTMPRFVSYAAAAAAVTVSAREGLVSSEGENIHFRNDVRLTRAPFADKSELVVETSYLHIIPDQNIARTDQPVTITDANTVVRAVGLELNNETQVLKLLSRVRGTYHDPEGPRKSGAGR